MSRFPSGNGQAPLEGNRPNLPSKQTMHPHLSHADQNPGNMPPRRCSVSVMQGEPSSGGASGPCDPFTQARIHIQARNLTILEEWFNQHGSNSVLFSDSQGNTLLHVACQNGNKKAVKFLLKRGASISASNSNGQTPLHYCYAYKYTELAGYMESKGADAEVLNAHGLTPKACFESGLKPTPVKTSGKENHLNAQGSLCLGSLFRDGPPAAGAGSHSAELLAGDDVLPSANLKRPVPATILQDLDGVSKKNKQGPLMRCSRVPSAAKPRAMEPKQLWAMLGETRSLDPVQSALPSVGDLQSHGNPLWEGAMPGINPIIAMARQMCVSP